MEDLFKINAYFDEESEEIEEIVANYIIQNMSSNINKEYSKKQCK